MASKQTTRNGTQGEGRTERTLDKPLIQAGVLRQAGDKVMLRPDQIERLEGEGYVRPAPTTAAGKDKETG